MSAVEELLHKLVRAPRILVVTENAAEAARLRRMLDDYNCEVVSFVGVDKATEHLKSGIGCDLVLVDNCIDSSSEASLLRTAVAECPCAPVVIVMGYGHDELPSNPTSSGFIGLFKQPSAAIDFEPLFRSLKLCVRKKIGAYAITVNEIAVNEIAAVV